MLFKTIIVINILFLIIIVYEEYASFKSLVFWGAINLMLPFLGFLIYVLFGNRLKFRAKKLLLTKQKSTKNFLKQTLWYENYLRNNINKLNLIQKSIIEDLNKYYNFNIWHNNELTFFYNGEDFFKALLNDILNAKKSINIEFYIFADDQTGKQFLQALCKKAKDGVRVKLIYDAIGSRKTNKRFWQKLKDCGVEVTSFFPPVFKIDFLNFKLNYRNHKKIVVIDGKVSYTGGINIRDDHLGKRKKLFPWRDTHVRIDGCATYALQDMFLNDFIFSSSYQPTKEEVGMYFPEPAYTYRTTVSVLESGPEKKYPVILNFYIQIIKNARKFLIIQSPYFIVEKNIIEEILNAKNRGVDVIIMLPKKPDKKFVYLATLQNIEPLINNNVRIYLYNGFLHSKTLTTDNFLSVGSCNFDNRSFFLNFENTCLIYNREIILKHKKQIEFDIKNSIQLSNSIYKRISNQSLIFKLLYKIFYKLL